MQNANNANIDLNKRIQQTQSRIAKLAGFQESQKQVIAQAKEQAKSIFGTDDILEIRSQIQKIEERNVKVVAFKSRAVTLCEQILTFIEKSQPIPEQLLADLEKAIETSAKHVPVQSVLS